MGVVAQYNGREINLADGWQGAAACVEIAADDVRCYDSIEESDRELARLGLISEDGRAGESTSQSIADCPWGWVCLWEWTNFNSGGRMLKWSQSGTKNLGDWDFRDQASSACVSRDQGGARADDWRTLQPDPSLYLGAGYCYEDFGKISYPYGGNWNNKADSLTM